MSNLGKIFYTCNVTLDMIKLPNSCYLLVVYYNYCLLVIVRNATHDLIFMSMNVSSGFGNDVMKTAHIGKV